MIVGNGDIAGALREVNHDKDILFFASGVSNSQCTDQKQFDREHNLLLVQSRQSHIVYFSSLCIYHSITMYADHKYAMEELVRLSFDKHTIVRLGNITWGDNSNTMINYLRDKMHSDVPYQVYNEYRFIVNKEQFISSMNYVVDKRPAEINLRGERLKVSEIEHRILNGKL